MTAYGTFWGFHFALDLSVMFEYPIERPRAAIEWRVQCPIFFSHGAPVSDLMTLLEYDLFHLKISYSLILPERVRDILCGSLSCLVGKKADGCSQAQRLDSFMDGNRINECTQFPCFGYCTFLTGHLA